MKNLKKLNRQEQKSISGGIIRCTDNSQCFGGFCCRRFCMQDACFEE